MTTITEAEVEHAALDWLSALGWAVAHGPDIARIRPRQHWTPPVASCPALPRSDTLVV